MEELKPCPFCGSCDIAVNFDILDYGEEYFCECNKCGSTSSNRLNKENAIATWNTRAGEKYA